MIFNSIQFLVFFMVVTIGYYQLKKQNARVWLLLLASCYFYMTFVPVYVLILLFTIVIDYFAGIVISSSSGRNRKLWLVVSIIANSGILVFYKYFNFLLSNIEPIISYAFPHYDLPYLNIILPIGLSFHTFQAMSYTIEVYRGKQPPERNFVVYALYVMYYPQLVAGPIERPQNMLHQFHEFKQYDWNNLKEGLARMMWGFFKKVIIADRVAIVADHAFANYGSMSSGALLIGAMLYSIQIYCDFSGYSDIALGSSQVMGIRLMENFKQPYMARGISEFWERWHVSLSTWFRDYVYIPLGGNRKGEVRRRMNVFIVFLLSGLWHGANWTFIAWGAIHGVLVTLFPKTPADSVKYKYLKRAILIAVNFILVTFCWVFFRANNISEAVTYIYDILRLQGGSSYLGLSVTEVLFAALFTVVMMVRENKYGNHFISKDLLFWVYMIIMIAFCYFFGVFGENQFIYFQF